MIESDSERDEPPETHSHTLGTGIGKNGRDGMVGIGGVELRQLETYVFHGLIITIPHSISSILSYSRRKNGRDGMVGIGGVELRQLETYVFHNLILTIPHSISSIPPYSRRKNGRDGMANGENKGVEYVSL